MLFREITLNDIPAIFEVRVSTDENNFTYEELDKHGITPESVRVKLETTYKGWLCEIDQQVVGFVIGDKSSGEIWVIAVLSEFINLRIGTKLLQLAEEWLIRAGNKTLWLTTDTNKKLRAYSFYLKNSWKERKVENGLLYMQKKVL